MADRVIKEHYVPQRYLKRFANGKKFSVFDKVKNQKRSGNIEDYACERLFYDVDFEALKHVKLESDPDFQFDSEMESLMEQIDQQHIEHWLGENVETWLFNPIDNIISTYTLTNPSKMQEILVLTEDMMNYLSLYISIQIMRTKEFREYLVEMYERLPLLLMKKFAKDAEEKEFLDSFELEIKDENYKKLIHAQTLMDQETITDFAIHFREKLWMVGINTSEADFITSDNPIVRYGRKGMHGFNSEGIEIMFPISSKLILILKDPIYFWFESDYHKHFIELGEDEVKYYNSFQVLQSYRYLFDKNGLFPGVENIIKKNPSLQNIKRNRVCMF